MSGSAQLFPVVGSNFNLPTPLPTEDVSDGVPGVTAPITAIQAGGTDGTDLRAFATDTNGNQKVIGPALNGAKIAINPMYPVLFGGYDGNYIHNILTDGSGRISVDLFGNAGSVLDGTPGSAVPAAALQIAGSDGANLRTVATDTLGNVKVLGTLTNNNAAPAIELGVLPALANAASPTWTEGNQVLESVDLSGNQRVVLKAETTKVIGTVNQGTSPWVVSGTVTTATPTNTNVVTGDAPTLITTAPSNGATQSNSNYRGALITALLGTVSGTTPTLSMQLQWSPDGGTTWINYGAATAAITIVTGNTVSVMVYPVTWSTFTSGAGDVQIAAPLPKTWRMVYTGGGVTFSIAIASVQVNYIL
jgi:hypothetical protein